MRISLMISAEDLFMCLDGQPLGGVLVTLISVVVGIISQRVHVSNQPVVQGE